MTVIKTKERSWHVDLIVTSNIGFWAFCNAALLNMTLHELHSSGVVLETNIRHGGRTDETLA